MYTAFYGLKEEPFRLTPDPRFLHLAEPHRAVLKGLIYGIVYRKGFVVTTGAAGTGKTTLLHTTLQILNKKFTGDLRISSALIVNPTVTREELLELVLDEFEVHCTASTKPRRLAALHEHLLATNRRGATSALIVDEAHLMSPELLEEIRLLSNVDTYQEKLLQIVLSGQPELAEVLAGPRMVAIRQRIAIRQHLRPLTAPETRAYVAERLYASGLRGETLFRSESLEAIHVCAQGIPRVINLLCDNCLALGYDAKLKQIGPDIVHDAAAMLGISEQTSPHDMDSAIPDSDLNLTRPVAARQASSRGEA